jgi:dTDP-L-rhamnose 4-epimerase
MADLVLVTGGAGFIGSHTVDRLLGAGFAVRVVDNLHRQVHADGAPPRHLSPEAELRRVDVRDLEGMRRAVRGATHVLHLAAETSVGQSLYHGDEHADVNVRGTAVLFRAIREEGVELARFVLSSSRAVYGEGRHRCAHCGDLNPGPRAVNDLLVGSWAHRCPRCRAALVAVPTTEDTERRYASSYGMSKVFQEGVGGIECDQLGIPLVVLRYFNVYGPRQSVDNPYTGLITTLALRLLAGRPLVLYERGTPIRDFVHVDDVSAANIRALTMPVARSQRLNVGTGTGITLRELADALARAFGREPEVELSSRFRVGDVFAAIAHVEQARTALGHESSIDVQTGLGTLVAALEGKRAEDRSEAVEDELRRRGVLHG